MDVVLDKQGDDFSSSNSLFQRVAVVSELHSLYSQKVNSDLVRIFWDEQGMLVDSSDGVPLLLLGKRTWVFPRENFVSSLIFFNLTTWIGAMPTFISWETLKEASAMLLIDEDGSVRIVDSVDGVQIGAPMSNSSFSYLIPFLSV